MSSRTTERVLVQCLRAIRNRSSVSRVQRVMSNSQRGQQGAVFGLGAAGWPAGSHAVASGAKLAKRSGSVQIRYHAVRAVNVNLAPRRFAGFAPLATA